MLERYLIYDIKYESSEYDITNNADPLNVFYVGKDKLELFWEGGHLLGVF